MVSSIYTLPQISFVGGETQKLTFSLFKRMGTKSEMPYDATGATVDFSLINYSNKIGIPILSKSAKIKKGEESSYNWAEVILNP